MKVPDLQYSVGAKNFLVHPVIYMKGYR